MDLFLDGKSVLVTGGAKGIGEGIVRSFAAEGARVAIVDRDEAASRALADELGDNVMVAVADLCVEAECRAAVDQIHKAFGGIDVLVNNAGFNDAVSLDQPPEAFMKSLRLNLFHVFTMMHCCIDSLKERQGCVVNIGSKVSLTGQGGTSGYAASKGGVNALTREWATELAAEGVRVNAVLPAEVMTPLYEACLERMDDPDAETRIASRIPLGHRFTTKAEIADTVVFLASRRSAHTTGQILLVDGGYTHLDRAITS